MSNDTAWKKLGPLPGILYAEMVGEVLKEKEIPYYLSQDWFSSAYGIKGTSAVGNKAFIFVPDDYYEEVSDIVKGMFDDGDETIEDDEADNEI